MNSYICWANKRQKDGGKVVEHVNLMSFMEAFHLRNQEDAIKKYEKLLENTEIHSKRRITLRENFTTFKSNELEDSWKMWIQD